MPRIALDTNVLAYAEGVERAPNDGAKIVTARRLSRLLEERGATRVIALQSLIELYDVLVRKAMKGREEAFVALADWRRTSLIVASDDAVLDAALELAGASGYRIYYAIIVAAAAAAGCDLLLSEDLQDGFAWRGLVVRNPFAAEPAAEIVRMLR